MQYKENCQTLSLHVSLQPEAQGISSSRQQIEDLVYK